MMQKIILVCILLFSGVSFSQNKLDIYFDFNKDIPNQASIDKLNQWYKENAKVEVIKISGFSDSIDDSNYNIDLAMRRINSVLKNLKENNILIVEKVELKPYGKDFNYSKNQNENRKVEVFYNKVNVKNPVDAALEKDYQYTQLTTLVEEEKATLAQKFDRAKKGDLVRVNNISFYFNSEKVMEQSEPLLEELFQIMLNNPTLRIEIHGHICCNPNQMDTKLSYRRALVILKYLNKKGIPVNRMNYKGFGSNDPIYRLPERNEKERAANRRVEILIVDKK